MNDNSCNQFNRMDEIFQRMISLQSKNSYYGKVRSVACEGQALVMEKNDEYGLPDKPLNIAVLNGEIETVKELLDSGADPEEKDGFYGNTGIIWAIKADNVEVLDLYRQRGFDLSGSNNFGWAPIHVAAEGSRRKSLFWLLKNGADVEAKDSQNQTPLFKAAYKGRRAAAKILLSYGANLDYKDMKSHTPLMVAVMGGHVEMVKLLLKLGADCKHVDSWGRNLLHFTKSLPLMEYLIEHDLDINGKDDWGRTPLHDAVQASDPETVAFLLEKGADIEAQDRNGCTPLHEAARTGRAEMIKVLLENGADLESTAKDGSTPLDVASDEAIKDQLFLKKYSSKDSNKINAKI